MAENIKIYSKTWVIDASFTINAIAEETSSKEVKLFLSKFYNSQKLLAPSLWSFGIGNYLRNRNFSSQELSEAMVLLSFISVSIFPNPPLGRIHLIVSLAQKHQLSYYDASYLFLAIDQNAGLASFDKKLQEAARAVNIVLLTDIW